MTAAHPRLRSGSGQELRSRLRCSGCGWTAPASETYPFRCAAAGQSGDDVDHVLQRSLELAGNAGARLARTAFEADEPNPFLRYRPLLHSWLTATDAGLDDADYVELATRLDQRIASVSGRSFQETPFDRQPELAEWAGVREIWVKDETGNVSGSHKARHMMGLVLWLAQVERRVELGLLPREARRTGSWAIASCGNAALAAAVTARAAQRALDVFVPEHAHPAVLAELRRLGSRIHTCHRAVGETGDPCYHAFRHAVEVGALPFSCQGNENALVIEGGSTLVWEMVSRLRREEAALDRLFIQVGGGALATACIRGLAEAQQLGLIEYLPKIHAVQTACGHPLARAWDRLSEKLAERTTRETGIDRPVVEVGTETEQRAARADWLTEYAPAELLDEAIGCAAHHRSSYMWPWETEPRSIATGILDDETYDWLAIVGGMLRTGGYPIVVSEERLAEAHRLCGSATATPADATGTSGLAGLLETAAAGSLEPSEAIAVLFTGVERGS